MAKFISANSLLSKKVSRRDRIVLLNPPAEDTRYNWVRWNQPLDLLKIGGRLLSMGCKVDLLDAMKPDEQGKVVQDWRPRDRRYKSIGDDRYPMHRFGLQYQEIGSRLAKLAQEKKKPSQVWIGSLCSYWYEGVAQVCRLVRQALPDASIVLVGQYARLMPQHAELACTADYIVTKPMDLSKEKSAFSLYEKLPNFAALQLDPRIAVAEVSAALEQGIQQFTFFEENVCRDGGQPLIEIFSKTKDLHKNLRYHLICGLDASMVTPAIAKVIADKQCEVSHFEETEDGGELNVEAYRQARAYLREAGMEEVDNRLSGFVWIGRPREQVEQIILRSFEVLNHLEGLILKPFSPTPGSPEHKEHEMYLSKLLHEDYSPHFFPFAELNGISRSEYHDLYRMAAFLNEKVRSKSFDFLKGTLGAQMLRDSLRRKVWQLEPSPLRLIS